MKKISAELEMTRIGTGLFWFLVQLVSLAYLLTRIFPEVHMALMFVSVFAVALAYMGWKIIQEKNELLAEENQVEKEDYRAKVKHNFELMQNQLLHSESRLRESNELVTSLRNLVTEKEKVVTQKTNRVTELEKVVTEKEKIVTTHQNGVTERVTQLKNELLSKNKELSKLEEQLLIEKVEGDKFLGLCKELKPRVEAQNKEIKKLKRQLHESRGYEIRFDARVNLRDLKTSHTSALNNNNVEKQEEAILKIRGVLSKYSQSEIYDKANRFPDWTKKEDKFYQKYLS